MSDDATRIFGLRALLALFVDNEECRFDHHGNCQNHGIGWDDTSPGECSMVAVRAALAVPAPAVPVGVQPVRAILDERKEPDATGAAEYLHLETPIEAGVGVQPAERAEPTPSDAEWRLTTWQAATHPYYARSGMALADAETAAVVAAVRADLLAQVRALPIADHPGEALVRRNTVLTLLRGSS